VGWLDAVQDAAARVRYGRTQDQIFRALAAGEIPGAPRLNTADTSDAERYASNYYGARKWGTPVAATFNAIALADLADTTHAALTGDSAPLRDVVRRKVLGALGADAGQRAAELEEAARRARLVGLFDGQRINR
jgi:hypothetical protein